MRRILAIATHPDDETLGCGGTLLKHKAEGDELFWLIVTKAWKAKYSADAIEQQIRQVRAVEAAYPSVQTEWLEFETTSLDRVPLNDLIDRLRATLQKVQPELVYLPGPADAHSDHRVVFNAATAVMKPFYMRSLGVRRILACEVPSETDAGAPLSQDGFHPQVFSDISKTLERKLAIMKLFETEMQPEPLPRSPSAIRAWARSRGATAGAEYAETFMLVRELV